MNTATKAIPALAVLGLAMFATPANAQLFPFQNTDPNVVRCESVESREVRCQVPLGKTAAFVEQHSQSPCTAGSTYFINRDAIVVTRGCRASFRLSDASVLGDATLRAEVRAALATALSTRVRADNGFSSMPSIVIDSERERPLANGQVGYDGVARVLRSNSLWRTVAFNSVYDLRTRAIVGLDYGTPTADPGTGSGTTETGLRRTQLRTRVDTALETMLYSEYRNSRTNPHFELLTDIARVVSTNETAYSGTGRINVDGSNWLPVTFEGTYDWRAEAFRNLTYKLSTPGGGTADSTAPMDEYVEATLERALAEEVRRQKGGGNVQVVVNRRHGVNRTSGAVRYTGKFGYSWNDGDWLTRGFEAEVNPSGQQVRSVRIWRPEGSY